MGCRLSFWLLLLCCSELAQAIGLVSFTPQGSIKKVSQIQARFDTDMIDFGTGRAPTPFKVDCPSRGDGRWLDSRTFVYDFVGELPGGFRCTFTLVQQKNKAGDKIEGPQVFSFDTGGPSLIKSVPDQNYYSVTEDQIFLLIFDSSIKPETLQGRLLFQVPQRADAIGYEMVPEADKVIQEKWPWIWEELKKDPKFYLLVKPKENLPSASDITLLLGKGIASPSGISTLAPQSFTFKTRPPFLASFHCERAKLSAPCEPYANFSISLSESILEKDWPRIRVFDKNNRELAIERRSSYFTIPGPHAAESSYRIEIPADLRDDHNRPLANAKEFPLTVKVGSYGPLIKFPGEFGILEASNKVWPLNIRKVEAQLNGRLYRASPQAEAIIPWLKKVMNPPYESREQSIFNSVPPAEIKNVPLKKPNGADAFEIVGVPLPETGFYVMEVASSALGSTLLQKPQPMYVKAAVLVTNLAVHLKQGRQGTLVWVTSLDKGKPVADADVLIHDCKGRMLVKGKTGADGVFKHPSGLTPGKGQCQSSFESEYESNEYIASATKDGDFSFTLSSWSEGIESWRFQLPWDNAFDDLQLHSILDRSLFRVGESVSMLNVARQRVRSGLAFPAAKSLGNQLQMQHIGSEKKFTVPIKWDDKGRSDASWKIPADAPLGWYSITIGEQESGRFRVDEFRLATLRGRLQPKETSLIAPTEIQYDFEVSYLSGGPAAGLPVKLRRSILGTYRPYFTGLDDYDFTSGPIDRTPDKTKESGEQKLENKEAKLDKAGAGTVSWSSPKMERPLRILTELEFPDASGEYRTVATEHKLWPANALIGIRAPYWLQKQDPLDLSGVVVDIKGQPLAGRDVIVKFFKEDILSHRRRSVGGTYTYEHKMEIKDLGELCRTESDNLGRWSCKKVLPVSGTILLEAQTKDDQGRVSQSHRSVWVAGERLWFMSDEHDRIDLIPEKNHYEAGETARIQVKMPFSHATLLVATERDGAILEARVQEIDSTQPFIDVPIQRSYAPNIFVSAWLVRGRVKGTEPFLKIDLGKPAFKLGITQLKVGWKQHTLAVNVQADKAVYKVRERVQATITLKGPDQNPLPADTIATVAVVDEALLELMGNSSWDLLGAMMSERAYGINHATAAMQVIGKRHFGLKALPQGGGGGNNPTRELFDTLILWKARVNLVNGQAKLEIPLQDNLSSFRIVAVAQAGTDMFGTGSTAIQTQQDLSIIAGLPPLVREGDHWQAMLTVRNRSKSIQQIQVKGQVGGVSPPVILPVKNISLKPDEAQLVEWTLDVPKGVSELKYVFNASSDQGSQDQLSFVQKVIAATPVRVLQASLLVIDDAQVIPVSLPDQAVPGQGGLDLNFSAGPGLESLQGVRHFFAAYPYTCLEQQISKAIGLGDKNLWEQVQRNLGSFIDADGLLKFFPQMRYGSPALTAYAVSISEEAGFTWAAGRADSLREALKRFVDGKIQSQDFVMPGDQLLYRKIMALEAISRTDESAALSLKNYDIQAELLPHNTLIDLLNIMSRTKDSSMQDMKQEVIQQLQSRLRLSGTQYGLAGEEYNRISTLLSTPDGNAARLLLTGINFGIWTTDHHRMLEGLLRRQQRGAWDTTVSNDWGTLALKKYLALYPAAGSDTQGVIHWQDKTQRVNIKNDKTVQLIWPKESSPLKLEKDGPGLVWATLVARAAVPLKAPFFAGYQLEKKLEPIEQKTKGKWSRGDIVRVEFTIQAGSDQTWVVLGDPIPAGSRILNASMRDETKAGELFLQPSFIERRHEGYFAYFEFMPAGRHKISYLMQLNNPGLFQLTTTRLEAMYAPDQYAELPNAAFSVD